ncbi:MAG: ATP-binding cassette domain-containing protein, partial [Prevotella sp.]|nr:ATP-binding cassette domain-containing protein [Prevotella sp.]
MITISNLKKQFGETKVCDIPSFTVNDGDILGLVGNNGAGKTTLFRMLLDLLKADEGFVQIDGINPAESETWKNDVGAYIDDGFLIDFLTPEEYFAFLGKISNMPQA